MRFTQFLLVLLFVGRASAVPPNHHVIIVSIDGFPAEIWRRADLPAPHLRQLAAAGASAEAMTVVNPSLTWPNHTSIVTGVTPKRHGLIFNGLLVPGGPGKPLRIDASADRTNLFHATTLYDVAFAAGLTTAESNWPATRHAPNLTWSFPEFPQKSDPLVSEMMAAGFLNGEELKGMEYGQPTNLPWHDGIWLRAATFMIERHQPNLLLYHILTTDASHHSYGPGSLAGFAAIAYADRLVAELVRKVEEAGQRADTTFIITSDHGFKKVSRMIYPNVILRKAGLLETAGPNVVRCDAQMKGGGGVAMVYVTDRSRRAELLPRLKELLRQCEGVDQVIDGRDGPAFGLPFLDENPTMGDLVLYPKNGYAFAELAVGDSPVAPSKNYGGTHGYLASDPQLDGIFIASGRGIKGGVVLPRVTNLDIAPTAAQLLGLDMRGVEGRVLTEILNEAGAKP